VRLSLSLLLVVFALGRAAAGASPEALRLVDQLQERMAQCRDYQCAIQSFERKGPKQEERSYRLYVKDSRLVRIKVTAGRGKGSEAALEAGGRVRGRRSGLLKLFTETLKPEDSRVRSLRGVPFWEAACHNFLRDLRLRIAEPGTEAAVEPDPEKPGRLLLVVTRPDATSEKYWIDPRQMQLLRGEVFEHGLLVREFSVRDVRENVGLSDDFFSF
jgi:outer membrane lipoprotein-sorting protein